MPVEVGDLVGFHRRKIPGMGIVMQKMDDVLDILGETQRCAGSMRYRE